MGCAASSASEGFTPSEVAASKYFVGRRFLQGPRLRSFVLRKYPELSAKDVALALEGFTEATNRDGDTFGDLVLTVLLPDPVVDVAIAGQLARHLPRSSKGGIDVSPWVTASDERCLLMSSSVIIQTQPQAAVAAALSTRHTFLDEVHVPRGSPNKEDRRRLLSPGELALLLSAGPDTKLRPYDEDQPFPSGRRTPVGKLFGDTPQCDDDEA